MNSWKSVPLLLLAFMVSCSARPKVLQEQNIGYYKAFAQGAHVGYESVMALMGIYENEVVKESMKGGKLIINEIDEQHQTEMKVIGIGLGRTGTTSVAIALEILGYTVVHDDEQPELTDLYHHLYGDEEDEDYDEEDYDEEDEAETKYWDGKEDRFHEILGLRGYNATFKTASIRFVARHKNVKAILTVRDNPDKYVDSWLSAAPFFDIVTKPPYIWMKTVEALLPSLEAEYRQETTGGNPGNYLDRETLKATYVEYLEETKASIPPERLLVFNVKQGWEPLCEYLGVPVPEGIPFPHVHTRAKLDGEMFVLRLITWIWPLMIILPLAALWAFTRFFFKFTSLAISTQK